MNWNSGVHCPACHQVNRLNAEWCMTSDRWSPFAERHESSIVPLANSELHVRSRRRVQTAAGSGYATALYITVWGCRCDVFWMCLLWELCSVKLWWLIDLYLKWVNIKAYGVCKITVVHIFRLVWGWNLGKCACVDTCLWRELFCGMWFFITDDDKTMLLVTSRSFGMIFYKTLGWWMHDVNQGWKYVR